MYITTVLGSLVTLFCHVVTIVTFIKLHGRLLTVIGVFYGLFVSIALFAV